MDGGRVLVELGDELDNRWANGWAAPSNPFQEQSFGDLRHSKNVLFAMVLAVGQRLDNEKHREYHQC